MRQGGRGVELFIDSAYDKSAHKSILGCPRRLLASLANVANLFCTRRSLSFLFTLLEKLYTQTAPSLSGF